MTPRRRSSFVFYAIAAVLVAIIAVIIGSRDASAQFDTPNRSFHNATTFPLEGKHQAVACEACHLNGQYRGTPKTCMECHWIRRKDDRYQTRLGTQCEQCHRPISWTAVRWDHNAQAGVALNADHRELSCVSCHRGGNFRSGTANCVSCHQKDYSLTKSPNHAAAGFPTTCDVCHSPGDNIWRSNGAAGGAFHNAFFPLVGLHASQPCAVCHVNNVYLGTPRTCVGCHQTAYNNTRNPNHLTAGFSTTCDTCHKPSDAQWTGASFNHSAIFALVGLHATQPCAACHVNSVYRGTPRTCVGCHQTVYNNTRNPNHLAAGFPTTCDSCHKPTDSNWNQAVFNHTRFPLTGRHNVACAQCHVTPNNFTVFSCTVCHSRSETDGQHRGRNGYVYESNACYSCHPNGRAG